MTFPQDVLDLVLVEEERYEAEDRDVAEVALPSQRLAEDAVCGPVRTLGPDSAAPDEAAGVAPDELPEPPSGALSPQGAARRPRPRLPPPRWSPFRTWPMCRCATSGASPSVPPRFGSTPPSCPLSRTR